MSLANGHIGNGRGQQIDAPSPPAGSCEPPRAFKGPFTRFGSFLYCIEIPDAVNVKYGNSEEYMAYICLL